MYFQDAQQMDTPEWWSKMAQLASLKILFKNGPAWVTLPTIQPDGEGSKWLRFKELAFDLLGGVAGASTMQHE